MKPAYMPFTFASDETITELYRLFGTFQILQPLSGYEPEPVAGAAADGKVEVLAPVKGGEDEIVAAARKLLQWAEMHHGHMDAFKAASEAGFYNETFATEIRSDILRGDSRKEEVDPLAAARLLLRLSQELDREQAELDLRLKASEARQKEMFGELKGGEQTDLPFSERYFKADTGAQLTENRVLSWLRLAAVSKEPPMVWATSSRAVFSYLMEFAPGAQTVCSSRIPTTADDAFREALTRFFFEAIRSDRPEEHRLEPVCEPESSINPRRLTIAALPRSSAEGLLQDLLAGAPEGRVDSRASRNILLVLLHSGQSLAGEFTVS